MKNKGGWSPVMVGLAVLFFPVTVCYFIFVWPFRAMAKKKKKGRGSYSATRRTASGQAVRVIKAAPAVYPDAIDGYALAYSYDDVGIYAPWEMLSALRLRDLAADPGLELRQEPENEFDPFAVALDWNGKPLGYLHRNRLQEMANRWLESSWPVYADFTKGDIAGEDSRVFISLAFYKPGGRR